MYLGPSFDKTYYAAMINDSRLEKIEPVDFAANVACLLYKGAVVGFFCGAMEYGPRALGGHSILVRATDPGINVKLNQRLNRTEFMPFAPVTLEEEAEASYPGWSRQDVSSYYMASCYRCSDLMKKQSPAAVHIDGTARPQIINRDINKEYYDVLKAYRDLSGIPSLINTSFNYHEEPIVCHPQQAIALLEEDDMDALALMPFILFKHSKWLEILNREKIAGLAF